jgi:hypothetical protein
VNADWEGSIDDKRSTSGAAFYLGDCLVTLLRKINLKYPYPQQK